MQKGQFSCELSGTGEGVSITKKPRMYIGVHYIDFFTEGSVFSCESSGTGEGVSITKKPRLLTVWCAFFYRRVSV